MFWEYLLNPRYFKRFKVLVSEIMTTMKGTSFLLGHVLIASASHFLLAKSKECISLLKLPFQNTTDWVSETIENYFSQF